MTNYSKQQLTGSSITKEITPTTKIISMTNNPIGLIGSIWYGSRQSSDISVEGLQSLYNRDYMSPDNYDMTELNKVATKLVRAFPQYYTDDSSDTIDYDNIDFSKARDVLIKIVQICLKADLPVSEAVALTIQVDNANVAWREQLVRSKFSSYFMQTSRIADLSHMDVNRSPDIKLIAGDEGVKIYNDTVNEIRRAYYKLAQLGVPQEDIRLQPQMNTHRVYWMTTFRALIKTLSARSGWIAQSTLWSPITADIIDELRNNHLLDVLGTFLGNPPVDISYESDYDKWYVSNYNLVADNEDRILGKDPLPVDPLYLNYRGLSMPSHTNFTHYDYLKSMFIKIWNDKVLSILGWNRSNPSQIGPYDRDKSYFSKVSSNKDLNIVSDNEDDYKSVIEVVNSLE